MIDTGKTIVLNDCGVIFNENAHTYHLEGKQLQGITGMIGRQLFPDKYSNVPDYILKRAAERGTAIHQSLHTSDIFGTDHAEYQKQYLAILDNLGLEILDNEYLVTDSKNFATAIDKVAFDGNRVGLCDVKTTYKLDKEYLSWQLSIGKYLFELVNPDIKVDFLFAIWVTKDDNVEWFDIDEKPREEVIKLIEAEANGQQYDNPNVLTVADDRIELMIQGIADIKQKAKELKETEAKLNAEIEKAFEAQGVEKWETDSFVISRRKGYTRKGFDKKTFEIDHPNLAKEYETEIEVKGSIVTKLK